MKPISVLDLCPVVEGGDASQAFANAADLAQHAEALGFHRYWLAEHHNMAGIASAATAVVIAHVAQATRTIRVGAGGVMLPNHAPLMVAEAFGTLDALFPGRIDLGLGRAPGTDMLTARALRRGLSGDVDAFPRDVVELMRYFQPGAEAAPVRAVPGAGRNVPIIILGSSLFGAQLAAALGLPFAFASHFAPAELMPALQIYRQTFRPIGALQAPYAIVAAGAVAAETDEEAQFLASSLLQAFINLRRGQPGPLPPPRTGVREALNAGEIAMLDAALACAAIGGPNTVSRRLGELSAMTQADELLITVQIFDHEARRRSLALTMDSWARANSE
jgi:luciferase family oxidoreductase group 1